MHAGIPANLWILLRSTHAFSPRKSLRHSSGCNNRSIITFQRGAWLCLASRVRLPGPSLVIDASFDERDENLRRAIVPMPPPVTLRKRLAPLADARIGLTLATTFLFFTAAFTIYTYFAVVFERAIGGNPSVLAGLLVVWGLAGTVSNLLAGRLIDTIGNRRVLVTMLAFVLADFVLLSWASGNLWSAIPAVLLWGACGWGSSVPQQHRIVSIAPQIAPIVLGLNNSAVFLGTTAAGIIGAAGIEMLGGEKLGLIAAGLVAAALIVSEIAARKIAASSHSAVTQPTPAMEQGKA